MGVSLYDQFTTTDWDFIASRGSQFSAGIALVLAVISCFLGFISWVVIYTLTVGLVLCIWELPILYTCVPAGGPCFCRETQTAVLQYFLVNPIAKAIIYFLLSIGAFFNGTFCVLAGLSLLLASILNATAAVSRHFNIVDGLLAPDEHDFAERNPPASQKFGTF